MEGFRVDPRVTTPEARAMYIEQGRKLLAFNQTIPFTPENTLWRKPRRRSYRATAVERCVL